MLESKFKLLEYINPRKFGYSRRSIELVAEMDVVKFTI
jgi:hypothetical protein